MNGDLPYGVYVTGQGHVPFCEPCEYHGKARRLETDAWSAVRHHICNPGHARARIRAQMAERRAIA